MSYGECLKVKNHSEVLFLPYSSILGRNSLGTKGSRLSNMWESLFQRQNFATASHVSFERKKYCV